MVYHVSSIDFDGCMFNKQYHQSTDKNVIAHNQAFLDSRKAHNHIFSKVYTMVGSARQSKGLDYLGVSRQKTGSCFPAIHQISNYLGATHQTVLMADIVNDLPDGTAYHRLMKNDSRNEVHPCCISDSSKLTTIYMQMHYIAKKNPGKYIIFDFFDDLTPIHNDLYRFFRHYPELIPSNISLQFNHYAGQKSSLLYVIKGRGDIDANYRQTVIDMIEITGHDLCLMPLDEAINTGLNNCFVWHAESLAFISRTGQVQQNISVHDKAHFMELNDIYDNYFHYPGLPKILHLSRQMLSNLIELPSARFKLTANDLIHSTIRHCVSEVTPRKLMKYQNQFAPPVSTSTFCCNITNNSNIQTRKSKNLQLEIERQQFVDNLDLFDPSIYQLPKPVEQQRSTSGIFSLFRSPTTTHTISNQFEEPLNPMGRR